MIHKDIVLLQHIKKATGYWSDPKKKIIEQCPIIPINQHAIYYNGVETKLLEDMTDLQSPEFLFYTAMCYAELKIIITKSPAKTCINKFCKTRNVCAAYKKLQFIYLGLGFTLFYAGQLKDELFCLKYKGRFKTINFQMYIACHEKILHQMENLKGIDAGTCLCYFLGGINKPSLKTAVRICESQASYSTDFHTCASYLTTLVQKTPAAKQVHIADTAYEIDGIKLKNRDNKNPCLPTAKYLGNVYKMLPPKQKSCSSKPVRRPRLMGMTPQQPKKMGTASHQAGKMPGVCCPISNKPDQ